MFKAQHGLIAILMGALAASACLGVESPADGVSPGSSGGAQNTSGGAPGTTGGSSATGGQSVTTGGTSSATGGAKPTGGSSATGGVSATGGTWSATGGAASLDASGPGEDSLPSPSDTGTGTPPAPLTECPSGSIDRLQKWLAHGHIVGSGGDANILMKKGERYQVDAKFDGVDYAELVVHIANAAGAGVDLSKSSGFTVTYSATADLYAQLRGTVLLHGGEQYTFKLPATGGAMKSLVVPFSASAWGALLGKPPVSYDAVLKSASFFNFIGDTVNTVSFTGLRFDGYLPTCK